MPDLPDMLAPAHYVPVQGLAYSTEQEGTVIVGSRSPLPVSAAPTSRPPAPWLPLTTVQDLTGYASAEIQVSGLSGADTISVLRSLDGVSFVAITSVWDMNGNGPFAGISQDGIYFVPGGGWVKLERSGTQSSPAVTLRAGQR